MSSNIERSRVQDTVSNSDDDEDYSTLSSPSSREHQISEAKRAYVSENSKKQLYLLCIGIKDDDGGAIFDLEMQPWKSLKKKDVKPSRGEYAKEVLRRSEGLSDKSKIPKTAYWSATKCIEWLQSNPIHNNDDILFLKSEVSRLRRIIMHAEQDREEASGQQQGTSSWRGPLPYLRLMLCLIQDDVRSAYLRRLDVLTHQELDARNSESRQQTAFEIIADRWNDSSFNPTAPSSICHEDFEDPTDCSYGTVISYSPATPQKVQDHLTSMRTNLLRIITACESSGQGDGGYSYDDEDDNKPETSGEISAPSPSFGALSGRNARALDQRSAFLRGKPSYLLYFWELMDQYQLLQSSLQIFNSESGASDASSVPSVIGKPSRRRGRQQDNENATANNILRLSGEIFRFSIFP